MPFTRWKFSKSSIKRLRKAPVTGIIFKKYHYFSALAMLKKQKAKQNFPVELIILRVVFLLIFTWFRLGK